MRKISLSSTKNVFSPSYPNNFHHHHHSINNKNNKNNAAGLKEKKANITLNHILIIMISILFS